MHQVIAGDRSLIVLPAVLLLERPDRHPSVVVPGVHVLSRRLRDGRRVGDRSRTAGRDSAVCICRATGAGATVALPAPVSLAITSPPTAAVVFAPETASPVLLIEPYVSPPRPVEPPWPVFDVVVVDGLAVWVAVKLPFVLLTAVRRRACALGREVGDVAGVATGRVLLHRVPATVAAAAAVAAECVRVATVARVGRIGGAARTAGCSSATPATGSAGRRRCRPRCRRLPRRTRFHRNRCRRCR